MTKNTLLTAVKVSLLTSIILLSLYLLLIAIVTTSHIENQNLTTTQIVSLNQLDSSLSAIYQNNDIKYDPANDLTSGPVLTDTILQGYQNNINGWVTYRKLDIGKIDSSNNYIDSAIRYIRILNARKARLKAYTDDLNNRLLAFKTSAKTTFSSNSLSFQVKYNYYQKVWSTFDVITDSGKKWLQSNLNIIREDGNKLNNIIPGVSNYVLTFDQYIGTDSLFNANPYLLQAIDFNQKLGIWNRNTLNRQQLLPFHRFDTPSPINNGSEWGAFIGWMAGWLIEADSPDFTLIIGMLGFGLFGAAISIFITKDKASSIDTIASANIEIIIKGFSAAIIIFLATKGGLAMINSGTNKPNPYVLYLGCLLGSVFSQPIWDWGSDYIKGLYKSKDTDDSGHSDDTDSSAKAGDNKPVDGNTKLPVKVSDIENTETPPTI